MFLHVLGSAFLYDHVRRGSKDLGLQVLFKAGHDTQGSDEGGDSKGDPGDRNEGIKGNRALTALGPEVPKSDENFVRKGHAGRSGRNWGNKMTSRMEA